MKASEIRRMAPEERLRKLNELRLELVKLRLQAKMGTLTNTARIRNVRRDIARILTVINEEGGVSVSEASTTSGETGSEGQA
ncbi:50S ribosomal protein L29P [Desulfurococcus amylolyticus 1221n]|uniref:Large ribosomal subunit protein uL29 n=1 Tax=Desulfurococcus amylolyticus (strain DSM 18924 / JCM 16383 / VKM B-2413 / 1221n) TaxID=490899 RepID=B8D5W3_DESA1|nr:50S ribosomal protein L29 [Desulfurococcus amylolyticus]ACL11494.1 50S ribosomal protein L29P [Desulfurococcus amylolyticus 1221n]